MTQIDLPIIRQSERGDFKMCPWKWDQRWNKWLVPKATRQDARWFGTQWHLLWALVYKPPGKDGFERSITNPSEIHQLWDELTKNAYVSISGAPYWGDDQEIEFNDAQTLGHFMIDGQLKEWNLDPGWEILQPEQRFEMKIPYNREQQEGFEPDDWKIFPEGRYIGILKGTYDIPIRDHTDLGAPKCKIVDWKTIARRESLKQMNKDDQTGSYMLSATSALRALGLIHKDESVEYIVYSYARKAKPAEETKLVDDQGRIRNLPKKNHYILALKKATGDPEVVTEKDSLKTMETLAKQLGLTVYGEVSKNQGSPLFWREFFRRNRHNKARQRERIADEIELMTRIRAHQLPIIKSPGDHCNWACDYSDLCDIDEDGGDVDTFIKDVYRQEDPYADHRPNAVNSKDLSEVNSVK